MRRRGALLVLAVCPSGGALAVDYAGFPDTLKTILDQRIAALNEGGGVCIAGHLTLSDGAPIHSGADAQVNFRRGIDEPSRMYDGGWFIMAQTRSAAYAGPGGTLVTRAFGYDPLDASITVLDGEMTYVDLTLVKTPIAQLASVVGIVTDEDDQPFSGATVSLSFPMANFGIGAQGLSFPEMVLTTGSGGQFAFVGLSTTQHSLLASASGYAYHSGTFTPPPGGTVVEDRRLFPNRTIRIRYAHQRDGTRNFTGGDLHMGTLGWLNGAGGADFSQARIEGYDSGDLRDLEMQQNQDVLTFRVSYSTGRNGYYDAGAVDFDQLTEAAVSGYRTTSSPVVVGHVYVVHTYEDQFVKFVVESDEYSFRTVVAGDPDPLVFAGYGLAVDFSYASTQGRLFVRQEFTEPSIFGADPLPSVWQLSGMTGVVFDASLQLSYSDRDLIDRRIRESGLDIFRSGNQGGSWLSLQADRDPMANTLRVDGLATLGWFAIANGAPVQPGDFDGDGDIDLRDAAAMGGCFSGDALPIERADCVPGLFDEDNAIGPGDVAAFVPCLAGPGQSPPPTCGQ